MRLPNSDEQLVPVECGHCAPRNERFKNKGTGKVVCFACAIAATETRFAERMAEMGMTDEEIARVLEAQRKYPRETQELLRKHLHERQEDQS